MIEELIKKNRSYRRFDQKFNISRDDLLELVNLARLSPSARNQQSLKYFLSHSSKTNKEIFDCLSWAGYLKDWPGPIEGERPSAYIIILNDESISKNHFCDEGIAMQSILLGAVEKNLGGCIFASINRPKLAKSLNIKETQKILNVIALGKPIEEVQIEQMENKDFKYWRDENNVHHVPKRELGDIIIE